MRALVLSILLTFAVLTAHAQDAREPRLSDRGRLLVEGWAGGYWARKVPEYSEAEKWAFHVQPGVTYFVWDRVGVGATVGFGAAERDYFYYRAPKDMAARDWDLSVGPTATWDLTLTDRLSLFVRPSVLYARRFRRIRNAPKGDDLSSDGLEYSPVDLDRAEYDAYFLRFSLSLPLTFHLSSSVAVGFGPAGWFDYFISQHPSAPLGLPNVGPFSDGKPTRGEPYPRTRLGMGLASWIGGSF